MWWRGSLLRVVYARRITTLLNPTEGHSWMVSLALVFDVLSALIDLSGARLHSHQRLRPFYVPYVDQ